MIRSKTRWLIASVDSSGEERAAELASALSIPPLVAKILVQRGFGDVDSARRFLYGGIECLHDPFLLKGMKEAVSRIKLAEQHGERILIYGDYDADGVSSTALMIWLFNRLELKFDAYIPHRTREGYGLNEKAIDRAAEAGISLIVTVDTGISAVPQIAYAKSLGIDVIVTDHHEPPNVLPDALALINPKQEDCPYPFKGLAGVGVAFKLAHALLGKPPVEWTDIAALGTIADLMPLTDENRIIVRLGLEQLRKGEKPGFRALAGVAGIELEQINSTAVAFGMAPRINAAGRLDHADGALKLLTAVTHEAASEAAVALDTLNRERQRIVDTIVKEAERMWADKCKQAAEGGTPQPSVIVLAAQGWNVGVVGIVASKLIDKYYKPTLILGIDPETGMCKGSARSIDGFDLYEALTGCEELLDHYGGHQAAAGMSLHMDKLGLLEARLGGFANQWLKAEDWVPKTAIDMECGMNDASLHILEQLSQLEPYGAGNAAPKLLLKGVALADRRTIGKEKKHLKLSLSCEGKLLDAIGFGFGPIAEDLSEGAAIEMVGELTVNEWNGRRTTQFVLSDMRIPHIQLFDRRGDSGGASLSALGKLVKDSDVGRSAVLVPTPIWLEAAKASQSAALPEGLRVITYEELEIRALTCSRLYVLGRPPSASKLAAAIRACEGLEAVYALYGEQRKSGSDGYNKTSYPRVTTGNEQTVADWTAATDRDNFGRLYQTLRRLTPFDEESCAGRIAVMLGWNEETVAFMLTVFEELGFILYHEGQLRLAANPDKKELVHSAAYREALRRVETDSVLFAETKELAAWITRQMDQLPATIKEGVFVS